MASFLQNFGVWDSGTVGILAMVERLCGGWVRMEQNVWSANGTRDRAVRMGRFDVASTFESSG